jgi:hypothetical protein
MTLTSHVIDLAIRAALFTVLFVGPLLLCAYDRAGAVL